MGGCTITKVADTIGELFEYMRGQITGGYNMGLGVDSELIVLSPDWEVAKIFKVEYDDEFEQVINFKEVEKGRAFHVGIAGMYGEKPKSGQLVGTVHMHT